MYEIHLTQNLIEEIELSQKLRTFICPEGHQEAVEGYLKGDEPKPAEEGDVVALRENILEIIGKSRSGPLRARTCQQSSFSFVSLYKS